MGQRVDSEAVPDVKLKLRMISGLLNDKRTLSWYLILQTDGNMRRDEEMKGKPAQAHLAWKMILKMRMHTNSHQSMQRGETKRNPAHQTHLAWKMMLKMRMYTNSHQFMQRGETKRNSAHQILHQNM